MKRAMAVFAVFVLCFGLLTGCGNPASGSNNSETSGNSGISGGDKQYAVTVTAPEGWEAIDGSGTLLRYKNGSGDFWVKQGFSGGTVESDIEYYQERENAGGYNITWEDAKDEVINGINAKYLKYIVDAGSLKMRYDVYFIQQDAALFTLVCLTNPDSDYGVLEADYKTLLDSLEITEK